MKLFRRITAGWCALLLYAATCSPVGLALAALVGSLDGGHRLSIQDGPQGLRLVLQHPNGCLSHRHGLAARALTAFAQPASGSNPDHVIQFSSPNNPTRQTQITATSSGSSGKMEFTLTEIPPAPLPQNIFAFPSVHSPPGKPGELRCLRAIVLLI